jgi:hypothetical protein
MEISRTRLRVSSPAPTNSTNASATSAAVSIFCERRTPPLALPCMEPSLSG